MPALFLARGGTGGAPFTGAELFAISTAFGLAVVAMVYSIGKISGCHINPAVTLAMAVTKRMPWATAVPYVIAQCVGGTLGGLAIWGVFAHKVHEAGVGHIAYAADTAIGSAMLNEGTGHGDPALHHPRHRRQARRRRSAGRPRDRPDRDRHHHHRRAADRRARSTRPATPAPSSPRSWPGLRPDWGQAWVYWVGDVVGGLVGVLAYDLLAKPRQVASRRARSAPSGRTCPSHRRAGRVAAV